MSNEREPINHSLYTTLEQAAGVSFAEHDFSQAPLPDPYAHYLQQVDENVQILPSYPDARSVAALSEHESAVLSERADIFSHTLSREEQAAMGILTKHIKALSTEYENLETNERQSKALTEERSLLWAGIDLVRPDTPSRVRSSQVQIPSQEEWGAIRKRDEEINNQLLALYERTGARYGLLPKNGDTQPDAQEQIGRAKTKLLRGLYHDIITGDNTLNRGLLHTADLKQRVAQMEQDMRHWQPQEENRERIVASLEEAVRNVLGIPLTYKIPPQAYVEVRGLTPLHIDRDTKAGQWAWFIGTRPPKENKAGQKRFDERVSEYEELIGDIRRVFTLDDEDIPDTDVLQLLPRFSAIQIAHFGKYGSFDMGTDAKKGVPSERKVALMLAAVERFLELKKRSIEPTDESLEIIEPSRFTGHAAFMVSSRFDFDSHYATIVNPKGQYIPLSQEIDQVVAMLADYKDKLGDLTKIPYTITPSSHMKGAYILPNGNVVSGKQAVLVLERLMQASKETPCSVETLRELFYPDSAPELGATNVYRRISDLRDKGVPIPPTSKSHPNAGYYIEGFPVEQAPVDESTLGEARPPEPGQQPPTGGKPSEPVVLPFLEGTYKFILATTLSQRTERNPATREDLLHMHYGGDLSMRGALNSRLSEMRRTPGFVLHEKNKALWLEIAGAQQGQAAQGEGKPEKGPFAQQLNEGIHAIKQKVEETIKRSNYRLTETELGEILDQFLNADGSTPVLRKAIANMFHAAHQLRNSIRTHREGVHLRGATFFQRHIDVVAGLATPQGDTQPMSDSELVSLQRTINEALDPFLSARMGGTDRSYMTLKLNATLNTIVWIRNHMPGACIRSVLPPLDYKHKITLQVIPGPDDEYQADATLYVAEKPITGDVPEHYEIDRREDIAKYIYRPEWRESFAKAFDYVRSSGKPRDRLMIILAPNTLPHVSEETVTQ